MGVITLPEIVAYLGAVASGLNLLVLITLAFKTGKFVGEIQTALSNLADLPRRVASLEKSVGILWDDMKG